MASLTKRTRRDARDRKDELLTVASALATTVGIDGLRAEAIAEQANTSRPLIFHYFGNLGGLQHAVVEKVVGELLTAVSLSAHSPDQDPHKDGLNFEVSREIIGAFLDHIERNHKVWLDIWAGATRANLETQELLEQARTTIAHTFMSNLLRSADTPGTRNDLLAAGWIAMAEKMTMRWLNNPVLTRDEIADTLLKSLRNHVELL